MDSSQGPHSSGKTHRADPREAPTPESSLSPEPALPTLLNHQGRTAPKVGVRVEEVNKSVPGPPGKLGNKATTGGPLVRFRGSLSILGLYSPL